jgi:hypothetical protein
MWIWAATGNLQRVLNAGLHKLIFLGTCTGATYRSTGSIASINPVHIIGHLGDGEFPARKIRMFGHERHEASILDCPKSGNAIEKPLTFTLSHYTDSARLKFRLRFW